MKAKLTDPWFDASFIGEANDKGGYRYIDSIEGAQGVALWCPCGYGKPEFPLDGGRPHGCLIGFANPRNAPALPAKWGPYSSSNAADHPRWKMTGSSLEDLTLTPSVAIGKPECWHGYITAGIVT